MNTFKKALYAACIFAFLIVCVGVIGQNQEPLSIELFNYVTPTYPKWVILLSCVFAGAIVSTIFFLIELMILETRNIRLRRLNQKLERALTAASGATSSGNGSYAAGPSVKTPGSSTSAIEEGDV